jgi:myosin heavy subunit
MNLKDIFDNAENGTLTYDQFMAAVQKGNGKFVDLSEGAYVAKQKYTDDLAARDTRIKTLDDTVKSREADLESLRQQLEAAGGDADKLAELNTKFSDLQKQYEKDTKAYQKQLKDQAYKFAVTQFADQQKFTSHAAKRDFINTMMAKNLQMDGDTIIGASDFRTAYEKDNADAFVPTTDPNTAPTQNQPHFVDSTTPNTAGNNEGAIPFHFHFAGVRPHDDK